MRPFPAPLRRQALAAALASTLGIALGACASSPRSADQVSITPTTVRVETPTGAMEARTVAEDRTDTRTVKAPIDLAWRMLPAVYGELGLPVNNYVDATHQIAVRAARMRGRVGKLRMPSIVQCGTDVTGEDKASSYEMTLDVMSTLVPSADGKEAMISTMVTANGRPMATSGEPVRCVTTGLLERTIATNLSLKSATAMAGTP